MRGRSLTYLLICSLAIGCGGGSDGTGTGGSTGSAGTTGTGGGGAGTTGTGGGGAGTSGAAGTTGTGGGIAGTTGTAGTPGTGGTAGTTGTGGGAAGTGGSGGGTAGAGGRGGNGGSAGGGTAGAGGRGGNGGSAGGGTAGAGGRGGGGGTTGTGGSSGTFSLTSPMHVEGAKFNGKYTCNGGALGAGVIPELNWTGVPAGTMSFALTFIDTTLGDTSPMGQHWAMYNIPWNASTGIVSKIPEGMKTLTGDLANARQVAPLGNNAFLSPCAQSLMGGMDDQYAFTLYALSTATLNVQGTVSVANVLNALKAAGAPILGTAKLTGHAGLKGQ